MAIAANPLALDILNDVNYTRIINPGVNTAIATIATYLSTMRFQATAAGCVPMLRDLIEDVIRGQAGYTNETVSSSATVAENLIVDGPTSTALGPPEPISPGCRWRTFPPMVSCLRGRRLGLLAD